MRALRSSAALVKTTVTRNAGTIQGVLAAACVAAGSFVLWGVGVALLALGGFLLIGAWGSA